MSEFELPEGHLILYMIHCPDCSASRMTEEAMRMFRFHYPEIDFRMIGRKRLGVEDILTYFLFEKTPEGLKVKALPTYFVTWSKRPRRVYWHSSGGVDSHKMKDVKELYEELIEGMKIARKRVLDDYKNGKV